MAVDTRKEAVENFIQSVLKDHVLSEGMPRTQSDTQDAYATVELLRSFLEKCDALEAQVKAADALASSGDALALRLRHVVGRECIVERWEARLAAYRAAKEGGA